MIALAALVAAQAVAVPGAVPKPVPVPVLLKHLHDWNGRQVAVRGWLHNCGTNFAPESLRKCHITPSSKWRRGRDRLWLVGFPRLPGDPDDSPVVQVVVRGMAEEDRCPAGDICLDGESDLRVASFEPVGRRRP